MTASFTALFAVMGTAALAWLPGALGACGLLSITVRGAMGGYAGMTAARSGPLFGAANVITLARGLLFCILAGFITLPAHGPAARGLSVVPALVFGMALATDLVDGMLARRTGSVSLFGEKADRGIDALGSLAAGILAYQWGTVHAVYLPACAAYYLFSAAMWARGRLGAPPAGLPASALRKVVGAAQSVFLLLALVPLTPARALRYASVPVALLVLGSFVRDWVRVTRVR